MSTNKFSFSLKPLTAESIPACADMSKHFPELDRHTLFKASGTNQPMDPAGNTQAVLKHYSNQHPGAVDMAMVVDDSTGQVIGWVVWGFRGFNSPEREAKRVEELKKLAAGGGEPEVSTSTTAVRGASTGKSARERLEDYTDADFKAWMRKLMPLATRCMYVCSVSVHPDYRHRGVGSALMRRGTDRADAEGVHCWVHSSEDGVKLFEKNGFHEVGRLELNLDDWNQENAVPPEGEGAKWGTYTFKYMRREADAA